MSRWCSEASCGAPTSPSSRRSLRRMVGSSSCAAWSAAVSQECHRGQTHTHTLMSLSFFFISRSHICSFDLQVRVEDGVHPSEAPSVPAASRHCESHFVFTPCDVTSAHLPACSLSLSVPQVFWMLGSMLIIILGMLVVPSLGWRWMIRISVAPSIILIFLFRVTSRLHYCSTVTVTVPDVDVFSSTDLCLY